MSSSYSDVLNEFDLKFFDISSSKNLRQSDAVEFTKKKIILTESLVKAYLEKRNAFLRTKECLSKSQLECKQVCVDYSKALQKCAQLEEQEKKTIGITKSLNEKLLTSENNYAALQSHTNQLEVLVTELKSQIEGCEIEKRLEKEQSKDLDNKIKLLEKDNELLKSEICLLGDVLVGSKKLNRKTKKLLKKYNRKISSKNLPCTWPENVVHEGIDLSEAEHDEDNDGDMVHTVIVMDGDGDSNMLSQICDKKDPDYCSYKTNSVDTGRGSSLAFSPEYSLDRPFDDTDQKINENTSSEVKVPMTCDRGISPINFIYNSVFQCTSPDAKQFRNLKDIATSPIALMKVSDVDLASEEIIKPLIITNCAEIVDKYESDDGDRNLEVESILNKMRLTYEKLSPLPPTPAASPVPARGPRAAAAGPAPESLDHLPPASPALDLVDRSPGIRPAPVHVEHAPTNGNLENENLKKIWNEFEVIINRLATVETRLKNKKDKKLKRKHSGRRTEASHNFDSYENNAQGDADIIENDIITIPENKTPENNIFSNDETNLNKKSCSTRKRLQFSETLAVDLVENRNNDLDKNNASLDHEEEESQGIINTNAESSIQRKVNKLSKLQKLKVSLIPKGKIKKSIPIKIREKRNPLKPPQYSKASSTKGSSAKSLNEKAVYEKALAVVAEIRAKENNKKSNPFKRKNINMSPRKHVIVQSEVIDDAKKATQEIEITDNRDPPLPNSKSIANKNTKIVPETSPKRRSSISRLNEKNILSSSTRSTRSKRTDPENNNNDLFETPVKLSSVSGCEDKNETIEDKDQPERKSTESRNSLKRPSIDTEDVQIKRKLRTTPRKSLETDNSTKNSNSCPSPEIAVGEVISNIKNHAPKNDLKDAPKQQINCEKEAEKIDRLKDYSDLTIFGDNDEEEQTLKQSNKTIHQNRLKESLLCKMIEKHAVVKLRTAPKKIPEKKVEGICKTIDEGIEEILSIRPVEEKQSIQRLVDQLALLPMKHFLSGLMKYLTDPARKAELLAKTSLPPALPVSKQQHVLLSVIIKLKDNWPSKVVIDEILSLIEFTMFRLNNTPEFGAVESLSHTYAVLCRVSGAAHRLRQFMLDAMYCLAFKAVPLIRQCLDVWPHILPLAHMGMAKQPLVTCLVYLLHFYKCEDPQQRAQALRDILQRKYYYRLADWSHARLIDMLRSAIVDMRDNAVENDMLRMAIIILAKRNGAKWCERVIIRGLLQPLAGDGAGPERRRRWCVALLGALLRPFPQDMRVHRELAVNQLFDMLENELSPGMEEAVFSALVSASRHDAPRVARALLLWRPRAPPGPRFLRQLRDYVRERPLRVWKTFLSKIL